MKGIAINPPKKRPMNSSFNHQTFQTINDPTLNPTQETAKIIPKAPLIKYFLCL